MVFLGFGKYARADRIYALEPLGEGLCPVAEDASRRTLALPFHPRLAEDEQELVVDALRRAIG